MSWIPGMPYGAEALAPILDDLNERQRRAVVHGDGPQLVLAGAGTGKTSVITRRIAWLVASKRARPSQILALTFTDKAAAEMQERVDVLVPYGYADVTLCTFHAFGRQLVAEYALELGLPGEPRVLDEAEALVFLREHLFELPLERLRPLPDPTRHLAALLAAVNRARDEAVSPAEYAEHAARLATEAQDAADEEEAARQAEIAAFYAAYLELLQAHGLCDYGQLLWLSLRLLEDHAHVRRQVSGRYRHVLVDEFQDTNVAQYRLLAALTAEHRNLTAVGDDDQCIYRFRGAAYSNLSRFLEDFADAERVVLVDNYRSTQPILDAAHRLVRHNDPDRLEARLGVDKRLVAAAERAAGPAPAFHWFDTSANEAEFVARRIREDVEAGRRAWGDFAVLARTHLGARPILQALSYRDVPFRYAGNSGLYDAEEVRACLHFLRAVADPGDSAALFHLAVSDVYRVPARDLAALAGAARRRNRTLAAVGAEALAAGGLEGEPPLGEEARQRLERCLGDLDELAEAAVRRPTGQVLYRFLERSGWLERLSSSGRPSDERQVQNLARFFELVRGFAGLAAEDRTIHFVRHIELLREAGDNPAQAEPDEDEPAVQVLTVHRAKGLEFPVVFLVDLEEGRFPTVRRGAGLAFPDALLRQELPLGDSHLEEERRLFYVAMTRARDELVLSGARDLGGKRSHKPSRFAVEALDLAAAPGAPRKATARQAIARHAPDAAAAPAGEPLVLSHDQIADYAACPLKYKLAHVLHVPLLPYHGVVYGMAVHRAIHAYYRGVLDGRPLEPDEVLATYESAWRSEGFLTREHEESRYAAGRRALLGFCERERRAGTRPLAVEREFRFGVDGDLVRGRFDRVDLRPEGPVIVDFKASEVRDADTARRRARESLQLRLYALGFRDQFGRDPVAGELHFVESGTVGRLEVGPQTYDEARAAVRAAAAGIRRKDFAPNPTYTGCQHCAFRDVCPSRYGGWSAAGDVGEAA